MIESVETQTTDFEVFPENWSAVEMFLRLQTQWNVIPGGFVGLNYQSIDLCFKMYGIKDRRDLFECLQTMEAAALSVLNKQD